MVDISREVHLERFEKGLRAAGQYIGLNGAAYKLILYYDERTGEQIPACERCMHGYRKDVIVGVDGRHFASDEDVIQWAIADSTHALVDGASFGAGFNRRPQV